MAFKDAWKKLTGKTESTDIAIQEEHHLAPMASEAFPVVKLQQGQLAAYKSIPLTSLAALGTAFSQIPDSARTITQSAKNRQLYIAVNPKGVQGYMQTNHFGENGNIMRQNAEGKHVISGRMRYQPVENLNTTLPFDPTLMVVAVALMTIEKKLDCIQKSVEEVLQFLKQEKQSRQRGNLNMLADIMEDYKLNCQNEKFCISRANEVLSIKTASFQDIDFYQNQISAELQKQKTLHGAKDSQNLLDAVSYQFAEYQLACHLFAFSSFLDILLQRNFDTTTIESVTEKMLLMTKRYEALYTECHSQIAKYQRTAIEAKILGGIGIATKGLGKAIGSIPVIKDGSVDEALISAGENIGQMNRETVLRKLQMFEQFEGNRMTPFIDNLKTIDHLYSTENAMLTDGETLYILEH